MPVTRCRSESEAAGSKSKSNSGQARCPVTAMLAMMCFLTHHIGICAKDREYQDWSQIDVPKCGYENTRHPLPAPGCHSAPRAPPRAPTQRTRSHQASPVRLSNCPRLCVRLTSSFVTRRRHKQKFKDGTWYGSTAVVPGYPGTSVGIPTPTVSGGIPTSFSALSN